MSSSEFTSYSSSDSGVGSSSESLSNDEGLDSSEGSCLRISSGSRFIAIGGVSILTTSSSDSRDMF